MIKKDETALTTLTDNFLLERMGAGDASSFEEVFEAHYDRVYGVLFRLVGNRVEAEDLTQEVFVKLYNHAFKKRLFNLKREHNLGAWLYRVATNMGYNAVRSRKRRWQRDTILLPDPSDMGLSPEGKVAQRETAVRVRNALAQLPKRQMQLLVLRQMGMSYAECAEVVGVSAGSVGTLLRRAAQAFEAVYEEKES